MIPLPPPPHLEVLPGAPRPRGHPLVRSDGAPFGHPWTRVSVGATGSGLGVLFEMIALPPLRATMVQAQDRVFEDECVELFWAGGIDPGRYAEIVVNPLGTLYTARIDNPHGDRASWTVSPQPFEGLEVSVTGSPEGPADAWTRWSCHLFAPWEALTPGQPPPAPGSTHRGNFYRIARGEETRFEALSPTGRVPPDFHVPARFARFTFPTLL